MKDWPKIVYLSLPCLGRVQASTEESARLLIITVSSSYKVSRNVHTQHTQHLAHRLLGFMSSWPLNKDHQVSLYEELTMKWLHKKIKTRHK